jgi:hypothetical protein
MALIGIRGSAWTGVLILVLAIVVSAGSAAAENGWVSGKVSEEEYLLGMALAGDPISGASVVVAQTGQTARTNSSGQFNLSLPEGRYTLSASASGFDGRTSTVAVAANRTTRCDFNLSKPSGNLTGTITDIDTQEPLQGVWVSLETDDFLSFKMNTTDSAGRYTLTRLPPGKVTISVTSISLTGKMYQPSNFTVVIVAGKTVNRDHKIGTPCSLTVTVKDPDGNPLAGAKVRCGGASGTTDENGAATLDVRPGSYTLEVSASGYSTASRAITVNSGPNQWEATVSKSPFGGDGLTPLYLLIIVIIVIVVVGVAAVAVVRRSRRKPVQVPFPGPAAQYPAMYAPGQAQQPWPPGSYYPPPGAPPPPGPPGPGIPPNQP